MKNCVIFEWYALAVHKRYINRSVVSWAQSLKSTMPQMPIALHLKFIRDQNEELKRLFWNWNPFKSIRHFRWSTWLIIYLYIIDKQSLFNQGMFSKKIFILKLYFNLRSFLQNLSKNFRNFSSLTLDFLWHGMKIVMKF